MTFLRRALEYARDRGGGLWLGLGVGRPGGGLGGAGAVLDEPDQDGTGVVVKDGFDDTDLPGWTEDDGDWSAPNGKASVNATSAQMTRTLQAIDETFVQATIVWPETDPPKKNSVLARWSGVTTTSDRDGYYIEWEDDGTFRIGKFVSDVETVLASASLDAPTGGETYDVQLYTVDGKQEAWISQGSTTLSDTDDAHDGKKGATGVAMQADTAANSEFDDFLAFSSKYVTVAGLATGQKAKVRDAGGNVVAEATESDGTATIDVSRFGGATAVVPLEGWADLLITDAEDTPIAAYTDPVYPGDAYTWVEGGGEEEDPDPVAIDPVRVTQAGRTVVYR